MLPVFLPQLRGIAVSRACVIGWLERHADMPLRYVAAPAGIGKTIAVELYAVERQPRVVWVTLEEPMDPRGLIDRICVALGLRYAADLPALVDLMRSRWPDDAPEERLDVVLDNIDFAYDDARAVLDDLYLFAPPTVRFIYIARNKNVIKLDIPSACGVVAVCGSDLFEVSTLDVLVLAESLGVVSDKFRYDSQAAADLLRLTDGSLSLISAVCRIAAAGRLKLTEAVVGFARECEASVTEHGIDEFGPEETGESSERSSSELLLPAYIETFGRFSLAIDGRIVELEHRRARALALFLATQPACRASREMLLTIFWPTGDRRLAEQCLASACEKIVAAIEAIVGKGIAAEYFVVGDDIRFTRAVKVSSQLFEAHCVAAGQCEDAGDLTAAYEHCRAAARLYGAGFLNGERMESLAAAHSVAPEFGALSIPFPESTHWCAQYADRLARAHAKVSQRMARLAAQLNTRTGARRVVSLHDRITKKDSYRLPRSIGDRLTSDTDVSAAAAGGEAAFRPGNPIAATDRKTQSTDYVPVGS